MFLEWKIGNENDAFKVLAEELKRYYELLRDSCQNPMTNFGEMEINRIMYNYVSIPLVKDVLSTMPFDDLINKYQYLNTKTCSSCGADIGEWIESTYLYKDDDYIAKKCKIVLCKECAKKLKDKLNDWLEVDSCQDELRRMVEDGSRHMAAMEQSDRWEKEFNESRKKIDAERNKIKDAYKGK